MDPVIDSKKKSISFSNPLIFCTLLLWSPFDVFVLFFLLLCVKTFNFVFLEEPAELTECSAAIWWEKTAFALYSRVEVWRKCTAYFCSLFLQHNRKASPIFSLFYSDKGPQTYTIYLYPELILSYMWNVTDKTI